MPDVGVLNLQIHDNSEQAVQGLSKLEGALGSVKRAVADGLKLSGVARQIKSIANVVNQDIKDSTLQKIRDLGDSLSGLKGLGNVRITIKDTGASHLKETIEEARNSVDGMNDGFGRAAERISDANRQVESFYSRMRDTVELVQNTNWTGGFAEFKQMLDMMLQARSAFAIGSGEVQGRLTSGYGDVRETGWTYYNPFGETSETGWQEWKEGAIEVEGTVSDAAESIGGYLEGTQLRLTGVVEKANEVKQATDGILESTIRMNAEMHKKYGPLPERSFEDVYNGMRWGRDKEGNDYKYKVENDLTAKWLRGDGTDNEQKYALEQTARQFGMTVEEVKNRIEELKSSAQNAAPAVSELANSMQSATNQSTGMDKVNEFMDYSQIDLMTMKMNGMKDALAQDIEANKSDNTEIANRIMQIQRLQGQIDQLRQTQEEATESTHRLRDAFNGFKAGIKNLGITKLLGQFARIAKYRILRSVIKQISSGFSEGIQNVYNYSKAIGSSFAPSMDSAASSLATMKNALGASVAPLLQSLIPYLQIVVNWFIELVNWVNQFVSLLRGQTTWTRAVPATTTAFNKQEKAAKKAGAAIKDLLADWDELNIIQSKSSGGGLGGSSQTAEDYLKMFEEVDEFSDSVKKIVNFIKDNLDAIKTTVGLIGAGILGWKISKAFAETLPLLSKIGTGVAALATIGVTLALTDAFGNEFANTGEPGWFIADALTGAVGAALAGKLTAQILGATAGTVTAGFTLVLAGAINVKNAVTAAEQQHEGEAWALNALGAIETGIGAGLIAFGLGASAAGSLVGGIIIAGLTFTIGAVLIIEAVKAAEYRQMAIDAFKQEGEGGISPEEYLKALQKRLNELTEGAKLVVDASLGFDEHSENFTKTIQSLKALNALVQGGESLSEEDAKKFKEAWDIVINELQEMSKINYETIYAGLDEAIAHGSQAIKDAAIEYRKQAIEAAGIMGGAEGKLKKEMEFLTNAISSGTATKEDIERYEEIYTILANETESGLEEFKTALKNGAYFDFSNGENPVDEAVAFIKSMGSDLVQPALDQVKAQFDAEIAAVNDSKAELDKMYKLGYIKPEDYTKLSTFYDGLIQLYTDRMTEQESEIKDSVQTAFDTILEQTLEGYFNLDQTNEGALKHYIDDIFVPIVEEIEKNGGTIPEKIRAIIARGGEEAWSADPRELARSSSRTGIYESFWEDQMHGEIQSAQAFSIAYELDLVGQDPSKIGEDAAKDIVNSMFEVFDFDFETNMRLLHNTFGWTYEDIVGLLDFGNLDLNELQELMDILDTLYNEEQEQLLSNANSTPNSPGYMDWYTYTEANEKLSESYERLKQKIQEAMDGKNVQDSTIGEKTNNVANSYEDMARRVRAAVKSLDGVGFDFDTDGKSGHVTANVPNITPAATGGLFRSGDIFSANENGVPEMIGRFGNQTGVANQDQIVNGIASGVSQANSNVESRLGTIETLLNRLLQKEFVAKAVPSTGWGQHNVRSEEAFSRVTG